MAKMTILEEWYRAVERVTVLMHETIEKAKQELIDAAEVPAWKRGAEVRWRVENEEDWCGWIDKIPFIRFDPDWDVQVIPPFSGAMVRFRVKQGDHIVSVYLDCYQQLGYWDGPYWGVYPVDGATWRVDIDDADGLLGSIRMGLKKDG